MLGYCSSELRGKMLSLVELRRLTDHISSTKKNRNSMGSRESPSASASRT